MVIVKIFTGRGLRERQCTLEWWTQYVNAQGSVQCGGVYSGDANFFKFIIEIDHHKEPKVTCLVCH